MVEKKDLLMAVLVQCRASGSGMLVKSQRILTVVVRYLYHLDSIYSGACPPLAGLHKIHG